MNKSQLENAAEAIVNSRHTAALTGAGISVESGIPPFRGKGGLWEKYDPMEYATIDAFMEHPEKVWRVLLMGTIDHLKKATPNHAHLGLAALESLGLLKTVITQNIDGLHQQAGNKDVVEFHGSFTAFHCIACDRQAAIGDLDFSKLPPVCSCGGVIRPDVVFFGEMIPPDHLRRSYRIAESCNVMLVVGTSATVQPAADLPLIAKRSGAVIIEINPESTPLTRNVSDVFLKGQGGMVMDSLMEAVRKRL